MITDQALTSSKACIRRRRSIGSLIGSWPVWLDRLHLGWLTGRRFLLVTHRGRRTGKLRTTAVMVLHSEKGKREVYAAAGNRAADWYRNIQASPAVEVSIGGRRYRPVQRFLTAEETASILSSCRRKDPFSARIQCLFFGWPWETKPAALLRLATQLGGVAFRLGPVQHGVSHSTAR